jgi:hypothetical protein
MSNISSNPTSSSLDRAAHSSSSSGQSSSTSGVTPLLTSSSSNLSSSLPPTPSTASDASSTASSAPLASIQSSLSSAHASSESPQEVNNVLVVGMSFASEDTAWIHSAARKHVYNNQQEQRSQVPQAARNRARLISLSHLLNGDKSGSSLGQQCPQSDPHVSSTSSVLGKHHIITIGCDLDEQDCEPNCHLYSPIDDDQSAARLLQFMKRLGKVKPFSLICYEYYYHPRITSARFSQTLEKSVNGFVSKLVQVGLVDAQTTIIIPPLENEDKMFSKEFTLQHIAVGDNPLYSATLQSDQSLIEPCGVKIHDHFLHHNHWTRMRFNSDVAHVLSGTPLSLEIDRETLSSDLPNTLRASMKMTNATLLIVGMANISNGTLKYHLRREHKKSTDAYVTKHLFDYARLRSLKRLLDFGRDYRHVTETALQAIEHMGVNLLNVNPLSCSFRMTNRRFYFMPDRFNIITMDEQTLPDLCEPNSHLLCSPGDKESVYDNVISLINLLQTKYGSELVAPISAVLYEYNLPPTRDVSYIDCGLSSLIPRLIHCKLFDDESFVEFYRSKSFPLQSVPKSLLSIYHFENTDPFGSTLGVSTAFADRNFITDDLCRSAIKLISADAGSSDGYFQTVCLNNSASLSVDPNRPAAGSFEKLFNSKIQRRAYTSRCSVDLSQSLKLAVANKKVVVPKIPASQSHTHTDLLSMRSQMLAATSHSTNVMDIHDQGQNSSSSTDTNKPVTANTNVDDDCKMIDTDQLNSHEDVQVNPQTTTSSASSSSVEASTETIATDVSHEVHDHTDPSSNPEDVFDSLKESLCNLFKQPGTHGFQLVAHDKLLHLGVNHSITGLCTLVALTLMAKPTAITAWHAELETHLANLKQASKERRAMAIKVKDYTGDTSASDYEGRELRSNAELSRLLMVQDAFRSQATAQIPEDLSTRDQVSKEVFSHFLFDDEFIRSWIRIILNDLLKQLTEVSEIDSSNANKPKSAGRPQKKQQEIHRRSQELPELLKSLFGDDAFKSFNHRSGAPSPGANASQSSYSSKAIHKKFGRSKTVSSKPVSISHAPVQLSQSTEPSMIDSSGPSSDGLAAVVNSSVNSPVEMSQLTVSPIDSSSSGDLIVMDEESESESDLMVKRASAVIKDLVRDQATFADGSTSETLLSESCRAGIADALAMSCATVVVQKQTQKSVSDSLQAMNDIVFALIHLLFCPLMDHSKDEYVRYPDPTPMDYLHMTTPESFRRGSSRLWDEFLKTQGLTKRQTDTARAAGLSKVFSHSLAFKGLGTLTTWMYPLLDNFGVNGVTTDFIKFLSLAYPIAFRGKTLQEMLDFLTPIYSTGKNFADFVREPELSGLQKQDLEKDKLFEKMPVTAANQLKLAYWSIYKRLEHFGYELAVRGDVQVAKEERAAAKKQSAAAAAHVLETTSAVDQQDDSNEVRTRSAVSAENRFVEVSTKRLTKVLESVKSFACRRTHHSHEIPKIDLRNFSKYDVYLFEKYQQHKIGKTFTLEQSHVAHVKIWKEEYDTSVLSGKISPEVDQSYINDAALIVTFLEKLFKEQAYPNVHAIEDNTIQPLISSLSHKVDIRNPVSYISDARFQQLSSSLQNKVKHPSHKVSWFQNRYISYDELFSRPNSSEQTLKESRNKRSLQANETSDVIPEESSTDHDSPPKRRKHLKEKNANLLNEGDEDADAEDNQPDKEIEPAEFEDEDIDTENQSSAKKANKVRRKSKKTNINLVSDEDADAEDDDSNKENVHTDDRKEESSKSKQPRNKGRPSLLSIQANLKTSEKKKQKKGKEDDPNAAELTTPNSEYVHSADDDDTSQLLSDADLPNMKIGANPSLVQSAHRSIEVTKSIKLFFDFIMRNIIKPKFQSQQGELFDSLLNKLKQSGPPFPFNRVLEPRVSSPTSVDTWTLSIAPCASKCTHTDHDALLGTFISWPLLGTAANAEVLCPDWKHYLTSSPFPVIALRDSEFVKLQFRCDTAVSLPSSLITTTMVDPNDVIDAENSQSLKQKSHESIVLLMHPQSTVGNLNSGLPKECNCTLGFMSKEELKKRLPVLVNPKPRSAAQTSSSSEKPAGQLCSLPGDIAHYKWFSSKVAGAAASVVRSLEDRFKDGEELVLVTDKAENEKRIRSQSLFCSFCALAFDRHVDCEIVSISGLLDPTSEFSCKCFYGVLNGQLHVCESPLCELVSKSEALKHHQNTFFHFNCVKRIYQQPSMIQAIFASQNQSINMCSILRDVFTNFKSTEMVGLKNIQNSFCKFIFSTWSSVKYHIHDTRPLAGWLVYWLQKEKWPADFTVKAIQDIAAIPKESSTSQAHMSATTTSSSDAVTEVVRAQDVCPTSKSSVSLHDALKQLQVKRWLTNGKDIGLSGFSINKSRALTGLIRNRPETITDSSHGVLIQIPDTKANGACFYYSAICLLGFYYLTSLLTDEVKYKAIKIVKEFAVSKQNTNYNTESYTIYLTSLFSLTLAMLMDYYPLCEEITGANINLTLSENLSSLIGFLAQTDFVWTQEFTNSVERYGLLISLQQRMCKIVAATKTTDPKDLSTAIGKSYSTFIEWAHLVLLSGNKLRVVLIHGEGNTAEKEAMLRASKRGLYLVIDPFVIKLFHDAVQQFLTERKLTISKFLQTKDVTIVQQLMVFLGESKILERWELYSNQSLDDQSFYNEPNKTVEYEMFVAWVNVQNSTAKTIKKPSDANFLTACSNSLHFEPLVFQFKDDTDVVDLSTLGQTNRSFYHIFNVDSKVDTWSTVLPLQSLRGESMVEKINCKLVIYEKARQTVKKWQNQLHQNLAKRLDDDGKVARAMQDYETNKHAVADKKEEAEVEFEVEEDIDESEEAQLQRTIAESTKQFELDYGKDASSLNLAEEVEKFQSTLQQMSKFVKHHVISSSTRGDISCVVDVHTSNKFVDKTFFGKKSVEVNSKILNNQNQEIHNLEYIHKTFCSYVTSLPPSIQDKLKLLATSPLIPKHYATAINVMNKEKRSEEDCLTFLFMFLRRFYLQAKFYWNPQEHILMDYYDCNVPQLLFLVNHHDTTTLTSSVQSSSHNDVNSSVPMAALLNELCTQMSWAVLAFHSCFPGMVHTNIKPSKFLVNFQSNKFKELISQMSSNVDKNSESLIQQVRQSFRCLVLTNFDEACHPAVPTSDTLSLGSCNDIDSVLFSSPELFSSVKEGVKLIQAFDIYSLAVSILMNVMGYKGWTFFTEQASIRKLINKRQYKYQCSLASLVFKLVDTHVAVLSLIFGEERLNGLKKMLWFVPQKISNSTELYNSYNSIHKVRFQGLLEFLKIDVQNKEQLQGNELLSPIQQAQDNNFTFLSDEQSSSNTQVSIDRQVLEGIATSKIILQQRKFLQELGLDNNVLVDQSGQSSEDDIDD